MSRPPVQRGQPPHCTENDCQLRQTVALESIASSLVDLKPAADTVHDLADRLERLCVFMRKKGPWLLASVPLVLSAVGAMTPEMADGLRTIIAAIAAQAGAVG